MRYVSVCTEGMLIHSWPCSAFVQNVMSKKLCVAKNINKKYPRTFLFAVYCIFCIFLSRLLCLFPHGCRLLPGLQALPRGPLDLSGLVGTDERDRWKPASYLTHTLAEQLSRWASLKPWGRPEGTMQRWHLHHRQHFTVYPSGWGNSEVSHFTLVLPGLPLVSTGDECVCFFGLVWCKMTLMSASGVSKKHVILQSFFFVSYHRLLRAFRHSLHSFRAPYLMSVSSTSSLKLLFFISSRCHNTGGWLQPLKASLWLL